LLALFLFSAAAGLVPGGTALADAKALAAQASSIFGELPGEAPNEEHPVTLLKVELGRMLYFDPRLSKNHDVSCNGCHPLARSGADGEVTSAGHRAQRGTRNAPSVYNAALHVAQFWDGRAKDVEEQVRIQLLNPLEMAQPDEEAVTRLLRSIPGYRPRFRRACPDEQGPVHFENASIAIAAFQRRLMTPGRFDEFMKGKLDALSAAEQKGLSTFISTGCITCHVGPAVGGGSFQKLGAAKAYPTKDPGRFDVTGKESDRGVFKVPSLRNVAKTAPYFHDGGVAKLDEAVRLMARHQLGKELAADEVASIVTFLEALSAEPLATLVAEPKLPLSVPRMVKPDPS